MLYVFPVLPCTFTVQHQFLQQFFVATSPPNCTFLRLTRLFQSCNNLQISPVSSNNKKNLHNTCTKICLSTSRNSKIETSAQQKPAHLTSHHKQHYPTVQRAYTFWRSFHLVNKQLTSRVFSVSFSVSVQCRRAVLFAFRTACPVRFSGRCLVAAPSVINTRRRRRGLRLDVLAYVQHL